MNLKSSVDRQWAKRDGRAFFQVLPLFSMLPFFLSLFLCFTACNGVKFGNIKQIGNHLYQYDSHGVWAPLWIQYPQHGLENEIAAVGVYGPTRQPERGRERATENGRNALSQAFRVHVQNVVTTWTMNHEEAFTGKTSAHMYRDEISRQVSDVELTGSVVKQFWMHPLTKMNYARITISLDLARQQAITAVRRAGESQKQFLNREKVDQAFQELDQLLRQATPEDFQEAPTIE